MTLADYYFNSVNAPLIRNSLLLIADFLCGHTLLHDVKLQRLIISETFNADSLRRTQLAKAGNPSDGVTLARVKKLQHETATMVQILEHLRTVSKSTGQLWSDEFQLLPLQELNGSRLTAPETACADR
ncbi:hypothetical protein T11_3410 [Trichinella zimbabwensis]|uniref:Uncharacterized protein n=1 Tax=Trichinella zimbabwensis TaxID=268475 RepID=A0A0V1GQX1_9BILA|nr:hypothetical protein T11_3410 [Trichinella zimbabwensis]